ncbi:hypothetical protein CBR_g3067 [Chara braunii]|uniref:Uncharacterized protein n=1 Tax=Chara braunii TaxID=69332 RepID=A0A388KEZ8_CHABU|nr:hypothetical protein CBR_g3067 [Chara braunii]|eukprot:GBG68523.1 hypothetical protein CBR_g3067 [Chara braunii]
MPPGLPDRNAPLGPPMPRGPGPVNMMRPRPPGPAPPMFPGAAPPPPPQQVSLPAVMEHKLATAQTEMQRLLTENQRLAATLVGLRQEVAAAQGEIQRLNQTLTTHQAESEASMRNLADSNSRMLEELRAAEPLKQELHAARMEIQSLHVRCKEAETARAAAHQQLQGVTNDFQKARQELSQLPAMRQEVQKLPLLRQEILGLRQELQQARSHLDFERKVNAEQIENRQRMESNLVAMARENEKLRAELTNTERRASSGGNTPWSASAPGVQNDWSSDLWHTSSTPPAPISTTPTATTAPWSSYGASTRRPA